jgi:hypothetical protein
MFALLLVVEMEKMWWFFGIFSAGAGGNCLPRLRMMQHTRDQKLGALRSFYVGAETEWMQIG